MGRKIDFWMSLKKFSRDVTSILSGFFLIRIVLLLFRKDLDLFCSILVKVVWCRLLGIKLKALCALLLCLRLFCLVSGFFLMIQDDQNFLKFISGKKRKFQFCPKVKKNPKKRIEPKREMTPDQQQEASETKPKHNTLVLLLTYNSTGTTVFISPLSTAIQHSHITQHKHNHGIFNPDGINGLSSIPKPPTNPSS